MPFFTLQIFKEGYGEKWSNTYTLEASGLAACLPLVDPVFQMEKSIHKSGVAFTYARVSDHVAGNDAFFVVPLNDFGAVTATASILPLFNTCRVDIDVEGFGRPSRKYYRLPLAEDEQAAGLIGGVTLSGIEAAVTGAITAVDSAGGGDGELSDPDGQAWVVATAVQKVQMRQLHRKRKRSA